MSVVNQVQASEESVGGVKEQKPKLNEEQKAKAEAKLTELTAANNMMMVEGKPVGIFPLETPSSGAAQSIQVAEQKAEKTNVVAPIVNAPSTNVNNVSNTTMNVGGNTSNQNNSFRRLADKNQLQR